jgi:hypothetical protein
MFRKNLVILVAIAMLLFAGCTTGGSFSTQNVTNVELSEPNFTVVAANVEGSSQAAYVFGFSFYNGVAANSFAVARIDGEDKLYDAAIQQIWAKYEAKHGPREGKKLAMTNIRTDSDNLNLLVYTEAKLFATADIVEFSE